MRSYGQLSYMQTRTVYLDPSIPPTPWVIEGEWLGHEYNMTYQQLRVMWQHATRKRTKQAKRLGLASWTERRLTREGT